MSTQVQLGDEVPHKDAIWRVVRIIHNDHSLFENADGTCYVIIESYYQLKSTEGEIDFVTLASDKTLYTGPVSTISALAPLPWRKQ